MSVDNTYEVVVVGGGMIGSSVAKYVSLNTTRVALAGPAEHKVLEMFILWKD